MGPATPDIAPPGFRGSPMLLAKARIKEMTEGKIKAPYPSPLPQSVLSFPPQPHQTLTHLWALTAPVPQPPCPFQKRCPKIPPAPPDLTCGCSPSPPLHISVHRPAAIPDPLCSVAGLSRAGMAGGSGCWRLSPGPAHICPVPASSIHRPASAGLSG